MVREVHRRLQHQYRAADLGNLPDPLDEAIYILLSRQTRENTYQQLYLDLRQRFPTWDQVLHVPTVELEVLLRPGGFQRQRAAQLADLLRAVQRLNLEETGEPRLDLELLRPMDNERLIKVLTSLPGVGPKSARCIMGYSLGRDVLAVDTHVARVMDRLGIVPVRKGKPRASEYDAAVPPRIRVRFHVNLIHHGRAVCTSRSPACHRCPVVELCPSGLS